MAEHRWFNFSGGNVPSHAIVAGHDSDGDTIYIGRGFYADDLLPAKVIPSKGKAYVAYAGQEVELNSYEVLSGHHYEWLPSSNGNVPPSAVKVGRTVDGETLYAGRGWYEGSLTVGKVHPSHGCLYIPYGSDEVKLTEYEVLSQPEAWVDAVPSALPEGAVLGGHDSNGDAIYVGRVFRNGDHLPAKIVPAKGTAYAAYASAEHEVSNCQVLVGGGLQWVPTSNGNILPGAISTGTNVDGEKLYVGRANYADSVTVGKVHPSHGCIYIPFGGEEIKLDSYELLVKQ